MMMLLPRDRKAKGVLNAPGNWGHVHADPTTLTLAPPHSDEDAPDEPEQGDAE